MGDCTETFTHPYQNNKACDMHIRSTHMLTQHPLIIVDEKMNHSETILDNKKWVLLEGSVAHYKIQI